MAHEIPVDLVQPVPPVSLLHSLGSGSDALGCQKSGSGVTPSGSGVTTSGSDRFGYYLSGFGFFQVKKKRKIMPHI